MKVRRKKAQPWDGDKSKLPLKLRLWMEKHPEHVIGKSPAVFPLCDAVQWHGHEHIPADPEEAALHKHVHRIPKDLDHPLVQYGLKKGLSLDEIELCGHCHNLAGHPRFVEPGDHLVMYQNGLIHHGNQDGKDISRWYHMGAEAERETE